jgi:hypothetical protein
MKLWMLLVLGVVVGCSSTDNGRTTRVVNRPATANDTPFGGGFPASDRPGYREPPFDPNSRRTELRPVWRGDNGAPETRINTGGVSGPDARVDRRTQ